MSGTDAASAARQQIRTTLKRWKGDVPPDRAALFRQFVDDTVERLRGPFLARHAPRDVLRLLEQAFHFAYVRAAKDVLISVDASPHKGVVVMSCMGDQPFIVDTVRLFLRRHKADYWGGFNLVFNAERDASGTLVNVGAGTKESLVLLEADAGTLLQEPASSASKLRTHLIHAQAMVTDFRAMTRTVERVVEKFEVWADREPNQETTWRETASFLKWLLRDNFVFMAMDGQEPLGFQRVEGGYLGAPGGEWPAPLEPFTVRVRKSQQESPVHRAGRLDEILISPPGQPDDVLLFIRGMFTYRAVTQPCRNVPILRRALADILADQESQPGSYRYKGIANVFDSLPTEFLFTASRGVIGEMVDLVFEAEQQQDVGVHFHLAGDTAFCLVAMQKTQYSDELRQHLEDLISGELHATYADHGVFVGRYETVLVHYYLTGVRSPGQDALVALTERIRSVATPWISQLWHALNERVSEADADRLAETYGRAFPAEWARTTTADAAVDDVLMLESLSGERDVVARVWEDDSGQSVLRLYQARNIPLTDILPVLVNFGLVVRDAFPTPVRPRGGSLHIDTFTITLPEDSSLDECGARLVDAIAAVFAEEVTDDSLNELVVTAQLEWRDVDVLRAMLRYARQLKAVSVSYPRSLEILNSHRALSARLIELFRARHDPARDQENRSAAIRDASVAITDALRLVRNHDEDAVFTVVTHLLSGMVRTNFYRPGRRRHYLSFKFDCSRIAEYGRRRPMFEIYVHHREVEGVHIRFGKVARGGLRWSDRDDYRTEILGLATTQQVKNVVIVPDGAKGGFYLKAPPRDPAKARAEADRLYKTFISGLLDLTDNNVDGHTVRPPGVVCHDPVDPYLVVAADKGTAHLSDTANGLSAKYGFWLGDAFASGGSNGYDHKGVGITARGAWVLVKRHFAEMGRDPYREPFTCVGVGDLSGDVFGNGLIESDKTRLLAAFNHRHIFLDPDPDPASTYVERKRLFDAGRGGGWENYDTSLISEGGGVFDRTAKSIPLSDRAREMLGLSAAEATPEDVVHAILKMDVDLLWNGGIGTYIKASTETHQDADDRSNDRVRVDVTELRCRIIGEGGNLGLTQRARIEAARLGVRLNTDFIDNSGGVDLSDHEVNLKILLNPIVKRGDLTDDGRNDLLRELTDEVANLVLRNSDRHGRQLSRDQVRSQTDLFAFARAITFIEDAMGITRDLLTLPTDAELHVRADRGEGMTRPELAVLSAWVKMYVRRELLKSRSNPLHGSDRLLHDYFPQRVRDTYADDISSHMLRDEIAIMEATNRIIADAGCAFFPALLESTGRSVAEIAQAYLLAQVVARADDVRSTLEEFRTSMTVTALYRAWTQLDAGTRTVAEYWLSAEGQLPDPETLTDMIDAVDTVYEQQGAEVGARNDEILRQLGDEQIAAPVALRILKAQYMGTAIMVWSEARRTGRTIPDMVVSTLAVARASGLQRVLERFANTHATGRFEPIGNAILERRFNALLRRLVEATPVEASGRSVDEVVPTLTRSSRTIADVRQQVDALLDADSSMACLLVLEARVAAAIARDAR